MAAFVATYPPLGQVTVVQDSELIIHAVLDVPREPDSAAPWQLMLWHSSSEEGGWAETEFVPAAADDCPTDIHQASHSTLRQHFTARLAVNSLLKFTVKFRQCSGDQEWRWVRSQQDSDDAVVVVKQEAPQDGGPEDLTDVIQDLNPDLKWRSHLSQAPGTQLWSIEAKVDEAKDDESAYADVPLGVPWGRFLRWFALVRASTPWLGPRQGKAEFHLNKDAMLCSFLSAQGKHLVLLGISGVNHVTTLLRSGDSDRLSLHIRSDNQEPTTGTVLVAVGDNIESTIAAVMYHARSLVTTSGVPSAQNLIDNADGGEEWVDGLGYCTWNSLGQRLSEDKILHALDTLAKHNINISKLIIDDNWQDIDYRGGQWQQGLKDFESEPKKFPRGLKALISDIRAKYKNVQHVVIWHAMLGYWAGLAPDGPLAKRYKTVSVTRDEFDKSWLPIDGQMTVVAEDAVSAFYDDFYRFLADCGIDGVKTDAQYMLDTFVSPRARRTLLPAYLDAWTLATLRHFSGRAIACMAQTPPVIFRAQLPRSARPPPVLRISDDFYPPDPGAQPWHVWASAHAALLAQHLAAVPDWDMFQTSSQQPGGKGWEAFHAAARCISGGPVYITDVPSEHDVALLAQVTGVSPRGGKAVVFRPSVLGRSLDVYAAYDDPSALLKVGAYHGRAVQGTGIVGVFNVADRPVTEIVPLARFPGVVPSERYVVRAHGTGRVTPPLEVGAPTSMLTVSLGVKGSDVLCAYPLTVVDSRTRGRVLLANLGLAGKMTGCAAVLRTDFGLRENGRLLVDATVKALGVLGIYISILPELSVQDDFMVTIQGQPIPPHTVAVNGADDHVLNIDIEAAWKEMGLDSGWANEVEVKAYFGLETEAN